MLSLFRPSWMQVSRSKPGLVTVDQAANSAQGPWKFLRNKWNAYTLSLIQFGVSKAEIISKELWIKISPLLNWLKPAIENTYHFIIVYGGPDEHGHGNTRFSSCKCLFKTNAKLLKITLVTPVVESNGMQVVLDYAIGFKQNCRCYKNLVNVCSTQLLRLQYIMQARFPSSLLFLSAVPSWTAISNIKPVI